MGITQPAMDTNAPHHHRPNTKSENQQNETILYYKIDRRNEDDIHI